PDGSQVAFDTGADTPSTVRISILDLRSLAVTTISKPGRYIPIFAGPHTVWAQEIKGCSGCGPVDATTHVYSIDTKTHAEQLLAIPWILDADVFYS
ncbi:MAG TPA: hypothetical protein VGW79_06645, partial [Actinomycetota bacterium]|nr:hypothetical protein [Actinomycetota bacterium]